uniref:3'(2'),5'-bisphosphate nucleotidase CysQ n=1 Tax=Pararhizobium sp. IMCC3301 TaxID=3067904 RepID=UPI002740FCDE|nr:3'(2'),5'-bisphosphate nucleotidase CysQ [Pararhizobium sp. IMCC3301]
MQGADTTTQDLADLALLDTTARAAGKVALAFFGKDPQVWMKQGASPVTEADFAVNHYLHDTLRPARPDYGWLSEESEDNEARLVAERLFVVDPIDGTRGFMAGSEDWTISVAVVDRKADRHGRQVWRPSSAALFNPCRDEMYLAQQDGGAFLNGTRIAATRETEIAGARFSISKPMYRSLELEQLGVIRTRHIPSLAYRLALVASGQVSAAIARPNAHDWDLAAADLLVHEAGGLLWGENGAPISYNSQIPRHGVLFASGEPLGSLLLALIR